MLAQAGMSARLPSTAACIGAQWHIQQQHNSGRSILPPPTNRSSCGCPSHLIHDSLLMKCTTTSTSTHSCTYCTHAACKMQHDQFIIAAPKACARCTAHLCATANAIQQSTCNRQVPFNSFCVAYKASYCPPNGNMSSEHQPNNMSGGQTDPTQTNHMDTHGRALLGTPNYKTAARQSACDRDPALAQQLQHGLHWAPVWPVSVCSLGPA